MLESFIFSEIKSSVYAWITKYFLGSVKMELIIKIFYELDFKTQAPFNHEIDGIYEKLSSEVKNFLEKKYNEAIVRSKNKFKGVKNNVRLDSFEKVLKENSRVVKNFKYDFNLVLNYSFDGIFFMKFIKRLKIK